MTNLMLCSTGKPQDFILNSNYIYELKKDGTRALIIVKDKKLRIIKNDKDITYRYPELEILGLLFNEDVVLDTNIVIYDKIRKATAIIYDILELNNQDLRDIPLFERKRILKEVFKDKNIKRFKVM